MNKKAFSLLTITILFLCVFLFTQNSDDVMASARNNTPAYSNNTCDDSRTVQVSGSALINVTPNRALVQLGVQSNAKTIKAVEQANTLAIQNVIAALKKAGIDSKDITTDMYIVNPLYEEYEDMEIKGYRINNAIGITVRDVSQVSSVVSTALAAGANQVNDVQFYTTELRTYRDQARELAITAAKEKAQALAKATGAKTGCVLAITENSLSSYNGWSSSFGSSNVWTQNVYQNAVDSSAYENVGDEPISLGQISVKAEVSLTYALE